MKINIFFLSFLSLATAPLFSDPLFDAVAPELQAKSKHKIIWTVTENILNPESAYYDPQTKQIFVSNVAGKADEKDGVGWISKLSTEGKVLEGKWVSGLNAPKGLRSYKGILWVTDIDRVLGVDLKSAKVTTTIEIPGSSFLNDIAIDKIGRVYVSDTLASKIYLIEKGKVSVFAEGPELESPNGLLVKGNSLIVGGWGLTTDFSTKVPGRLYSLNLKTKKKTLITSAPFANLDGLEAYGKGYLVSDWVSGKVFRVDSKGNSELIMEGLKGAADIGYILNQKLLLVPRMLENKVTAVYLQ